MRFVLFFAVAVLGTALDLATKDLAFRSLRVDAPEGVLASSTVELLPGFLKLHLSQNRGAAFGILEGQQGFFLAISALATFAIAWFVWSAEPGKRLFPFTLGFILAGVLGNLYDRLMFGHVRDFIDLYVGHEPAASFLRRHLGHNQWPTFNLADSFICIGAALMIIQFWRDDRAEQTKTGGAKPSEGATAAPASTGDEEPARQSGPA